MSNQVERKRAIPEMLSWGICSKAEADGMVESENRNPIDSSIDHPPHYNSHPSGIECIVVVEHYGFNLGNVIKYLWRAEEKGAPLEDLKKARWYLDREIQRREK